MPRLLTRRRTLPIRWRLRAFASTLATVALALAGAGLVAADGRPSSAGFQLVRTGGGSGGLSGEAIWAATWWEGSPEGPTPYLGGPAGGEDICIWHDLGPALADLDEGLSESGLPLSFWRQPDGGGHPGIWGVNEWAASLLVRGTGVDHFDLVACPDVRQVPASGDDVEASLPEGQPPTGRPLHLWIFWDTVPDPPPGHVPGVVRTAFGETHLPRLAIGTSPSVVDGVRDATVVNLETWLWVARAHWSLHEARASVGGYVATVWAVPSTVLWRARWDFPSPRDDPEGGTTFGPVVLRQRCPGPGVPYRASEAGGTTDCEVAFSESSFGTYQQLRAGVDWQVFWALSNRAGVIGGEGRLPDVVTTSRRLLRVMQVEAVISNG